MEYTYFFLPILSTTYNKNDTLIKHKKDWKVKRRQIEVTLEPKEQHNSEFPEFSFCFRYPRLSTGEASILETSTGVHKNAQRKVCSLQAKD